MEYIFFELSGYFLWAALIQQPKRIIQLVQVVIVENLGFLT